MFKSIFLISFVFLLLSGCESVKQRDARVVKDNCSPGNYVNWVRAGRNECLSMKIFGTGYKLDKKINNPKTLLIYISGDHPLKYDSQLPYSKRQRQNMGNDTLLMLLTRPGYSIDGNISTGNGHEGYAYYSQKNIDTLMLAVKNLRKYYKPEKVLLVGNSSGASAVTLMLSSRYSYDIDYAVVSSCPCSFFEWAGVKNNASNSLDPIDTIYDLAKNTRLHLFVGSEDTNTSAEFTQSFFYKAKKAGLRNVEMTIVEGAKHNQTKISNPVLTKIQQIISL
jgi:hypothetical protein